MQTLTSLCSLRPDFGRNADWLLEQCHRIRLAVESNGSWKRSFLAWLFSRTMRRRRREGFCCLFIVYGLINYEHTNFTLFVCLFFFECQFGYGHISFTSAFISLSFYHFIIKMFCFVLKIKKNSSSMKKKVILRFTFTSFSIQNDLSLI